MMVPGLSRVACLWDPTSGPSQVATTENAARTMKLKLQILEVGHRDDVEGAFRAARDGQAQALNVLSSPFLASIYREIIDHAAEYGSRQSISGGNLPKPAASCLMDRPSPRCGHKTAHWWRKS